MSSLALGLKVTGAFTLSVASSVAALVGPLVGNLDLECPSGSPEERASTLLRLHERHALRVEHVPANVNDDDAEESSLSPFDDESGCYIIESDGARERTWYVCSSPPEENANLRCEEQGDGMDWVCQADYGFDA